MDGVSNDFHHIPGRANAASSFHSFRELQQQGQLCDVELVTSSEQHIPAHRLVLAAASPYFRAMFVHSMLESVQRTCSMVDFDSDIVQAVVMYAYDADFTVPAAKVLLLMVAADFYEMITLYKKCSTFIQRNLKPKNCLTINTFARLHSFSHLLEVCTKFACDCFEEVTACDEYLYIPCEDLKNLICRDEIEVSCEEKVYTAVLRWVHHDLESRKDLLPGIMEFVRLPLVSSTFFTNVVEREMLLIQENRCKLCKFYIDEATTYKKSPNMRRQLRCSQRIRPRKPYGLENVVLTIGDNGRRVEQYDADTDSWTDLGRSKMARRYDCAACFHNGWLYAIGGFLDTFDPDLSIDDQDEDTDVYFDSVDRYHVKENKWSKVAPMLQCRTYHAAQLLYGLIYVTGGADSTGTLSSVECYNPETDQWVKLRSMNQERRGHGLAEVDGLIYAVGGNNLRLYDPVHHEKFSSVECYNPCDDVWTFVCSLSVPRDNIGAASLGGSIYAVGGEVGSVYEDDDMEVNMVERYDVEMDKWFPCPSTIVKRSSVGVVTYGGCLYACGGYICGSKILSMEKYSPDTQTWELCDEDLSDKKYQFGIVTTYNQ